MSLKSNIFSLGPQEISEFRSGVYFQQENGSFSFTPFPSTAQLSPVLSMNWEDDSKTIWLGGNFSGFRVDLGKSTASAFSAWKWENEGFGKVSVSTTIPAQSEVRNHRSISVSRFPGKAGALSSLTMERFIGFQPHKNLINIICCGVNFR